VREALVRDPPYGAQVRCHAGSATGGWSAPALAPWLDASISRAPRRGHDRSWSFELIRNESLLIGYSLIGECRSSPVRFR